MKKFIKKLFKGNNEFYVPNHPRKEHDLDGELTDENLRRIVDANADMTGRVVSTAGVKMTIYFIDGLVSSADLSRNVILPLLTGLKDIKTENQSALMLRIKLETVNNLETSEAESLDEAVAALMEGCCVMVFDEVRRALCFQAKGGQTRSVSEPDVENVLKGAKDAFVESVRVNTSLVRRKLKTPKLTVEETTVGRQSLTKVDVVYIDGLTNGNIVSQVKQRLEKIDVESLLSTAALEEQLLDGASTAFPLMLFTDLTDRFCKHLLQGRVGILIDGLPLGYILPVSAAQFIVAPEDENNNYIIASSIRLLRYLAVVITLLLPAIYVAMANFHQEMIPYKLIRAIVVSKENVPFNTAAEVLGMLLAFEVLQEAGLRLPKSIGQTVSIIGALVVGQSAVEAKIFSPVVVIVVAVAGVAGYTIPNQDFSAAIRLWRIVMTASAAMLGLFGMAVALMIMIYHMASIEIMGVPYLAPIAGRDIRRAFSRSVIRPPIKDLPYRDEELKPENIRRQKT